MQLVVTDTGCGIDAADLPRIFERFHQADRSTSRRHGGLGIGLALARQIVEIHGGRIAAQSDGPGHGATFTVTLPLRDASAPAAPAGRGAGPSGVLDGVRVLVVDDQPDTVTLFADILAAAGDPVRRFPEPRREAHRSRRASR